MESLPFSHSRDKASTLLAAALLVAGNGCALSEGDHRALQAEVDRLSDHFKCGIADASDTILPVNLTPEAEQHGVTMVDFSSMDAANNPHLRIAATGNWTLNFFGGHELGSLNFLLDVIPEQVSLIETSEGATIKIPVDTTVEDENGAKHRIQATIIFYSPTTPQSNEAPTWLTVESGILVGDLEMGLWLPRLDPTNETTPPPPIEQCETLFGVADSR